MTTRTAQCSCGALRAEAEGDPISIVACSCFACQRRTGSALGVGAYYPTDRVKVSGSSTPYTRTADSGQSFTSHFCPSCGTSLYWRAERLPGTIGIAVGAFGDPKFGTPHRSVFEESKHGWVGIGADIPGFIRGRDSEQKR